MADESRRELVRNSPRTRSGSLGQPDGSHDLFLQFVSVTGGGGWKAKGAVIWESLLAFFWWRS